MHAIVYLVLTWIYIFHIKDVYMKSTRENNSLIYTNSSKVYIHFILNPMLLPEWSTAVFCLVIDVNESLVCPEQLNCLLFFRKILQVPVIVGKSSNTQKCWKTKPFVGPEGFFWRTADSLTVQDKQGTREQQSLNKKTQLWIIQVTTQY